MSLLLNPGSFFSLGTCWPGECNQTLSDPQLIADMPFKSSRTSQYTHRLVNTKHLLFWSDLLLRNNYYTVFIIIIINCFTRFQGFCEENVETNTFWAPTVGQRHNPITSSCLSYKAGITLSSLYSPENWGSQRKSNGLKTSRFPDNMSLSPPRPQGSSWDSGFKRLTCMTFTLSLKFFI